MEIERDPICITMGLIFALLMVIGFVLFETETEYNEKLERGYKIKSALIEGKIYYTDLTRTQYEELRSIHDPVDHIRYIDIGNKHKAARARANGR